MENIRAGTAYEITPTIEEIIRECNAAWEQAKQVRSEFGLSGVEATTDDASIIKQRQDKEERVYSTLARDHADLNKTYPVILAAMAAGSYSQRAVSKFFKFVHEHPWRTEAEFLDVQSVYHTMLYRATTRGHVDQKKVAQIREQTRTALTENEKKTKEQLEQVQREAEENNRRRAKGRLIDILNRVPRDSAILTRGEVRPIVVSFDDS